MKVKLNRVLLSIVAPALATLFVAAASWSVPHDDERQHDASHRVAHLAKVLDLSEEQEAEVQTLLTSTLEASEADKSRLHVLKQQLLNEPGAFDAGSAQVTADEVGQITSRMVYRMASTYAAIYQLLDDEQRVEMQEMAEKMGERGGRRHGHPRFPF
ncbi:MAG: Spy/CpxP family protein refolding chaperone [Halioglobus sp.]|nr:Spy/CpxP family protein refolding chaperone [Halioglobus sp.]